MIEKDVEPDFARQVISRIAARWGFANPTFLRWFDNMIYRVSHCNSVFYLRLTPVSRRTKDQVVSELDILRFLASRGFPAAQPVANLTGDFVAQCECPQLGLLNACAFTACPGLSFRQQSPTDLGIFFHSVGSTMGRLHRELRGFVKPARYSRMAWNEERWDRFSEVIPTTEIEAWMLYEELSQWWDNMRTSREFGLIHGDFTVNNLHYDDGRISLFDFDCSCEHWYGYDLACFLHFFSRYPIEQRKLAYDQMLNGYAEERAVSKELLKQIPYCGKMKLLRSFLVGATERGLLNLTPDQEAFCDLRRRQFGETPFWPPT